MFSLLSNNNNIGVKGNIGAVSSKTTLISQPLKLILSRFSRACIFYSLMALSTPTGNSRVRRESDEEAEHAGSSGSRLPDRLNATVSFPPLDPLRLYASAEARDVSATSAARQITDARARPSILTSQASSFDVLRQSQRASNAEPAERAAPRSRRASPPNRAGSQRASPSPSPAQSPRSAERADLVGAVFIQTMDQCAEQMAAQSAAQISAFSSMMRRFEEMQAALPQI